MCGVAGYFGNFESGLLDNMGMSIKARGPDNTGTWLDALNGVGLVHTRLSIIDLSDSANQPMWDVDQNVVITFNGEIYNYQSLRADLIKDGYRFKTSSDTEVLLNLYLRDGMSMLRLLNGIFAFAIWDTRTQDLVLARDGQGIKPLYYSQHGAGFIFASELKAILQERRIDRALDYDTINYLLTYLWAPCPNTMIRDVKKLEPGHALKVRGGRIVKKWQFYDLPYDKPISDISTEDAIEGVRERVRNAVESQLVSDVPVGAFLSGGLDSSAIVALAKKAMPEQDIKCFTIGFKGDWAANDGFTQDLPYAEKVARYLGVELHTVTVGSEMLEDLEKVIYHMDEPNADPAPINALYICQLARQQGIKVLLSGAGGDDIFTGYRRHYALSKEKYWAWLPRQGRDYLKKMANLLPKRHPLSRRIGKVLQYADLTGDERLVSYFYWMDPNRARLLFSEDFNQELRVSNPGIPLLNTLSHIPSNVPALNKMLYLEAKHFLADHNLNYTDKIGMAAGIEVRVPLLDPSLIDYVTQLPVNLKQKGKEGKWIFKKAMEPYLPKDVIYRSKTGFGVPLRHWIHNEMSVLVEDVLSPQSLNNRGLFNNESVQNLLMRDRHGIEDVSYPIFALICIELWCRMFIDKPVPSL